MTLHQDLSILDNLNVVLRILALVTEQDRSTVARKLLDEHREVGSSVRKAMDEWGLAYYQSSDQMNEFYSSTHAFLFETIVWNRSPLKQAMRAWILQCIPKRFERPIRVLSFGDGLGFDSLAFAKAGHEVDFFEVSEQSIKFARELFVESGANIRVLEGAYSLEPESYDVILLLDVLEHVHNPERCVAQVTESLRPGGFLYTHSPFWLLTSAVSTHLAENQKFSGDLRRLFTANGLRPTNSRLLWNPIEFQKTGGHRIFQRPLTASLRIWLGGYLLWWGRYWNRPHIAAVNYLFSQKQEHWKELEDFCHIQEKSSA